jgi:hypothetical protein
MDTDKHEKHFTICGQIECLDTGATVFVKRCFIMVQCHNLLAALAMPQLTCFDNASAHFCAQELACVDGHLRTETMNCDVRSCKS